MNFWEFWQKLEDDEEDDDDYGFTDAGFWGQAGAGILAIAQDTGRILLQKRSSEVQEPNTFGVVGGALKNQYMQNLDFESSAKEEFLEETGSHIQKLIPAYQYKDSSGFVYQNFIGILPQEFTPEINWEAEEYRWVTWDQLLQIEPKHFGLKELVFNSANLIKRYSK
jgi:8-oxo-dGTP pyrophosphatase MutT (NUDIX family)